jgi:transposase-like protein
VAALRARVILCAVRWNLGYSLSYRDVQELLGERGLEIDHCRAINSAGATIDFFLSAFRSAAATKALFAGTGRSLLPSAQVINTDKAECYPSAIYRYKGEGVLRRRCRGRELCR